MRLIGISAFYHDSAVAFVEDGQVLFAAQEERYTRVKHDASFPSYALLAGLKTLNWELPQVDHVVFYEKPFLKMERLLETAMNLAPRGFAQFSKAFPVWAKEKLFQRQNLTRYLKNLDAQFPDQGKLLFSDHHLSHAASAFYPSPFAEATVVTMDGVGEWATTAVFHGKGEQLIKLKEIHFPDSLGLFYSAFTAYLGFKVNSGEYKMMGLAPYGQPRFREQVRSLFKLYPDGSYRLDQSFFDYSGGLQMFSQKLVDLFSHPPRDPESPIEIFHMDVAASAQTVLEEVALHLLKSVSQASKPLPLCLAGGVALNCVLNRKIQLSRLFPEIWIQPAAGDAGGALGAALAVSYQMGSQKRLVPEKQDMLRGSYLGSSFSDEKIQKSLENVGAVYRQLPINKLCAEVAALLASGACVGWFQGAMEFGPRALGNRSILADPRLPEMQKTLNLKIKFREGFRPFAPAVLAEKAADWFDCSYSPYMLLIGDVLPEHRLPATQPEAFGFHKLKNPRSSLPAVTHVDFSARLQTVHQDTNPLFHQLIQEFDKLTGVPVLVNTSFNVRGEPIVCTPEDAFRCFMGTDLDYLVVGSFLMSKEEQNQSRNLKYVETFARD